MVRRALTRQTRWYQIRCSIFKIKDFIVEKPFWKILEFWPLETPILTWAKKWPKWFRNDFSRAFERCLSFFSTATRSRDHGGAFKRPPPPPAGGGKSRGPAGRGLRSTRSKFCLKTDNFEVSTARNLKAPILTFDLTLTWHVTSFGKFRGCFRIVSSRAFERLSRSHLSAAIRSWVMTWGRLTPPPPSKSRVAKYPSKCRVKRSHWEKVYSVATLYRVRQPNPEKVQHTPISSHFHSLRGPLMSSGGPSGGQWILLEGTKVLVEAYRPFLRAL